MASQSITGDALKKIVPLVSAWAVARMMEAPKLSKLQRKLDKRAGKSQKRLQHSLQRAKGNVQYHRGYMVAGLAALAVAAGMFTRASLKK